MLLIFHITLMRKTGNLFHHSLVGIHIKKRGNILADYSKSFQPHTGINVLLHKLGVVSLSVIVKLREYYIPYLNKTVTFSAHYIFRTGTVLFTAIIVNLGTGTAGSCAVLPEIVCLTEAINSFLRNTDFFRPNFERFFIIKINTGIKSILRKSHSLR